MKDPKFTDIPGRIRCNWWMKLTGDGEPDEGLCSYLNRKWKGHLYCGQEQGPVVCKTGGRKEATIE